MLLPTGTVSAFEPLVVDFDNCIFKQLHYFIKFIIIHFYAFIEVSLQLTVSCE